MRQFFILILSLLSSLHIYAQEPRVTAELDSMTILMGGQVGLNIKLAFPESANVTLLPLADTLTAEVEVVEALKPDTSKSNGIVEIMQRYLLTSFDSGLHYIDPLEIAYTAEGDTIKTEALALNVVNPFQQLEIDEESGVARITDIKNAIDAPFLLSELLHYWPWAVGAIVVAALIFVGIYLYHKYRNQKLGIVASKPKEPCDVVALRELEQIREEKLCQRNMFKEYYSGITDTLRKYVAERFKISALESTTDEIIGALENVSTLDINSRNKLADVLQLADFVKFAKMEPLPDENDTSMKKAIEFVSETAQIIGNDDEEIKAKEEIK